MDFRLVLCGRGRGDRGAESTSGPGGATIKCAPEREGRRSHSAEAGACSRRQALPPTGRLPVALQHRVGHARSSCTLVSWSGLDDWPHPSPSPCSCSRSRRLVGAAHPRAPRAPRDRAPPTRGSHNAGRDCLECHNFTVAGTVYQASGAPASGATVRVTSGPVARGRCSSPSRVTAPATSTRPSVSASARASTPTPRDRRRCARCRQPSRADGATAATRLAAMSLSTNGRELVPSPARRSRRWLDEHGPKALSPDLRLALPPHHQRLGLQPSRRRRPLPGATAPDASTGSRSG